jgi:transcriptional repressor NrdR
VTNSRPAHRFPSVWRRRSCKNCGVIFSTRETPDLHLSIKVKRSAKPIEPFIEEKLFLSVYECFSHRNDALEVSKSLTATILNRLLPARSGLVETKEISEAAYQIIRRFDRPAAVYYKTHH